MKQRLRDLEARELWIEARVDELMDDDDFVSEWVNFGEGKLNEYAREQATREHASIIADLEEALIDSGARE